MSRFGSRRFAFPDIPCPVQFDRVPAVVGLHESIDVYFVVDECMFRPKSGDWIGLFQCEDPDERSERGKCSCANGIYSFVAFQWAPKRPNIAPDIAKRHVLFRADQLNVGIVL